eukprot:4424401-Amphidinium_carterae.1
MEGAIHINTRLHLQCFKHFPRLCLELQRNLLSFWHSADSRVRGICVLVQIMRFYRQASHTVHSNVRQGRLNCKISASSSEETKERPS